MLPKLPSQLVSISSQLPKAKQSGRRRLTMQEKIDIIKKRYNLTHGKGKRKKRKGKR